MRFVMLSSKILIGAFSIALFNSPVAASNGPEILEQKCASCHVATSDDTYFRIDSVRKTPEAWDMTVVRMMRNNGVELSGQERKDLVKYLADKNGLDVSETQGYRYILEKNPVANDEGVDQEMTEMCSRCHSYARVALQRRTSDDWMRLINFHIGQFPTMEYQALARDRDWWGIVRTSVHEKLAKLYPLGTPPKANAGDLSGSWRVTGHQPGVGDFDGVLNVTTKGDGSYALEQQLSFSNGENISQKGKATVFGAGEWRASFKGKEGATRQVMALSSDGSLNGRWFKKGQDVVGGTMKAVRMGSTSQVMAISPSYVRHNEITRVEIMGVSLAGVPDFGPNIKAKLVQKSQNRMIVDLEISSKVKTGTYDLSVGQAMFKNALVVYDKVDRIAVEPEITFSRVGGNGGPIPKVPAQFEAIAYMSGVDGKPNTDDDVRIGVMPASWKVDNFDAQGVAMEDSKFAGKIQANGLFIPGDAGPNPKRVKGTSNVGNLAIIATVKDGDQVIEGKGQLYATVQRFVNPPIR